MVVTNLTIIIITIWYAIREKNNGKDNDDDDDGGIYPDDPILDLPPGVSLPVNSPDPVLH